jgi:hypothetical protein
MLGFGDYRRNATCSLNETIENMVQFAMNDYYSGWNDELKAFDYTTDVKHTVKLVSSLHPLSMAVITDNEEIYQRRAKADDRISDVQGKVPVFFRKRRDQSKSFSCHERTGG